MKVYAEGKLVVPLSRENPLPRENRESALNVLASIVDKHRVVSSVVSSSSSSSSSSSNPIDNRDDPNDYTASDAEADEAAHKAEDAKKTIQPRTRIPKKVGFTKQVDFTKPLVSDVQPSLFNRVSASSFGMVEKSSAVTKRKISEVLDASQPPSIYKQARVG